MHPHIRQNVRSNFVKDHRSVEGACWMWNDFNWYQILCFLPICNKCSHDQFKSNLKLWLLKSHRMSARLLVHENTCIWSGLSLCDLKTAHNVYECTNLWIQSLMNCWKTVELPFFETLSARADSHRFDHFLTLWTLPRSLTLKMTETEVATRRGAEHKQQQ